MKQKFVILRNDDEKTLIIREHAELDKDVMSPLYEETYQSKDIKDAIKKGREKVISAIRTKNMYPLGEHAEKIAESVINLYASKDKPSAELFFNDLDLLIKEAQEAEEEEELSDESEKVEDLIEDDKKKS